jgi:type IV pilus assembly protein PilB
LNEGLNMEAPLLQKRRLGDFLIAGGHLTPQQLQLALNEQRRTGALLGDTLRDLGFISEEALTEAVASQSGIASVDLEETLIDPEALALVPEALASARKLIPIAREGNRLVVAMANPLDIVTVDELQAATGLFIDVVSATETEIGKAIDASYSGAESQEDLVERCLRFVSAKNSGEAATEAAPIIKLANHIIVTAIKQGATDIHVEPETNIVRTRLRVDGKLKPAVLVPKSLQGALTTRLKIMADLNIAETRLPQDGRIFFNMGKKKFDIRVSTFPTIFGENLVLRLLDRDKLVLGLDRIGLHPTTLARFKEAIERPNGIVLVTGPTGSGKTTTLYSVLSYINSIERNIITVEDPVEYELPIVRQCQVNVKAGLSFAACLRSILRQDPDVVLIGEMRDAETSELAVRAALTGHLVFSTLHTNSAAGAVSRLLDMGIDPYLICSSLVAVLAQRLVRVICRGCREPAPADAALRARLESLGLEPDLKLFRGRGCQACGQTGYRGRAAIFELLVLSSEIRSLIHAGADELRILAAARGQGMRSLREDGLDKVREGVTTLEEVLQASVEDETPQAAFAGHPSAPADILSGHIGRA